MIAGVAVSSCVACSSWDTETQAHAPVSAAENPAVLLGSMTARQVVDALPRAGVATVRPVDDTDAQCPTAGCVQSIVTDGFRVMSFPSTGKAESYAADHQGRSVETIAVTFPATVAAADRDRDWNAIVELVR